MAKSSKSNVRTTSKRRSPKSKPTSAPARKTRQATASTSTAVNGSNSAAAAPARSSTKAVIVALLKRPDGAAIGDLTAATGWQVHSVRAALTGLRKEGKELVRSKDESGTTHYRLADESSPPACAQAPQPPANGSRYRVAKSTIREVLSTVCRDDTT